MMRYVGVPWYRAVLWNVRGWLAMRRVVRLGTVSSDRMLLPVDVRRAGDAAAHIAIRLRRERRALTPVQYDANGIRVR